MNAFAGIQNLWQSTADTGGSLTEQEMVDALELLGYTVMDPPRVRLFNYEDVTDTTLYSDSEILDARSVDLYFEHASVGGDLIAGLQALAGRYISVIDDTLTGPVDAAAFFSASTGLGGYDRGNSNIATKLSTFVASLSSAPLTSQIDAAGTKLCFADWGSIDANTFTAVSAAYSTAQAANPDLRLIWFTCPLRSDQSSATCQAYNEQVRDYCQANDLWLFDLADIECRDAEGVQRLDVDGREIMQDAYTSDGGHLSAAGQERVAMAFWSLLAEIGIEKRAALTPRSVIYNANGATSGDVPVDAFGYISESPIVVLDNTGVLELEEYVFSSWNTQANGLGTTLEAGDLYEIGDENLNLYAIWTEAPSALITEDFEDATLAGGYTLTNTGSGVTIPSLEATHDGLSSMRVDYGAAAPSYISLTGGNWDTFTWEFWYKVPTFAAWQGAYIAKLAPGDADALFRLRNGKEGAGDPTRLLFQNIADATETTVNVTAGAFYKISIEYVRNADSTITVYDSTDAVVSTFTDNFGDKAIVGKFIGDIGGYGLAGAIGYIDSLYDSSVVV